MPGATQSLQTMPSESVQEDTGYVHTTEEANEINLEVDSKSTYLGNFEANAEVGIPKIVVLDDGAESAGNNHARDRAATLPESQESRPLRQPSRILNSEEQTIALQTAPDSVQIKKIWTLNSFERRNHPALREKFLLYYHEPRNQWTQVTVSVNYGDVLDNSFEKRLLIEPSGDVRSAWLYAILRPLLLETNLYPTMTNFEIKSHPDGRLFIWITEDTEVSCLSVCETTLTLDTVVDQRLPRCRFTYRHYTQRTGSADRAGQPDIILSLSSPRALSGAHSSRHPRSDDLGRWKCHSMLVQAPKFISSCCSP